MNKTLIRLVGSGVIAASTGLSSIALADSASIELTGPDSTNIIAGSSSSSHRTSVNNWVDTGNWSHQRADSGDSWVTHNTRASGSDGSGSAHNTNTGDNRVSIHNSGSALPWSFGGGKGDARIELTGPDSHNVIRHDSSSRFENRTTNVVHAANFNSQHASTGDVVVSKNTVASGHGGSGHAINRNEGSNEVNIHNSSPTFHASGGGGGGSATIHTTGPDSTNVIRGSERSSVSNTTTNVVSANNYSSQRASTGDVVTHHNTVAGGGSSGSARNDNSGDNSVRISN